MSGQTQDCRQKKYCNCFTNAFGAHLPLAPQISMLGMSCRGDAGSRNKIKRKTNTPEDVLPNIEIGVRGTYDSKAVAN